jgi:hypothetical protein
MMSERVHSNPLSVRETILLVACFPAISLMYFLQAFFALWWADWWAEQIDYLLSFVLLIAIILTMIAIIKRWRNLELRFFLFRFLGFMILFFVGDVILALRNLDENFVSISDYFWLSSYFFIMWGSLFILRRYWKFKMALPGKMALILCFVIAVLVIRYIVHHSEGAPNDLKVISLTTLVLDFTGMGVLIAILFKYFALKVRIYWIFILSGLGVTTIADVFYFGARLTNHYFKYHPSDYSKYVSSDSMYLTAYFLFILGALLAIQLRSEDNPETLLNPEIARGNRQRKILLRLSLLFSIPIWTTAFSLGATFLWEWLVTPMLEPFVSSHLFLAGFSCMLSWGLVYLEARAEAKEYYAKTFEECFIRGMHQEDRHFLEIFARSLKLSRARVKKAEGKVLLNKKFELKIREKEFGFDQALDRARKQFNECLARLKEIDQSGAS